MARVSVDTSDLRQFSRAIRLASRSAGREFRTELMAAGEIIAEDARARAEAHSKRIPETIKTRVYGANIAVQAGSDDVPTGVLFELGNTAEHRDILISAESGQFRHPVFGDRSTWVSQDMHRYLGPAALEHQVEALERLGQGVNRAFESVRLEWE